MRFTGLCLLFLLIHMGLRAQNPFSSPPPQFLSPDSQIVHMEAFRKAGLGEKKIMLVNWALNEVIPKLSEFEVKVDDKFTGVHYVGDLLLSISKKGTAALPLNVAQICDSASLYWRGVMEMSPGNELIPLSKTMLLVANGDFDMAKQYVELLRPFASEKTLAAAYIKELSWRLEEFNKELNGRMQRGLELHEQGNYDGALTVYKGVLTEYPKSAWVNYELYYSGNVKAMTEKKDSVLSRANWDKARPVIYRCNPMYPVMARANNGKEGYELYRRAEQVKLFKDKEKRTADIQKLGDIALDLNATAYAGEIYWLCFSRIKKEDLNGKEMLPYFLYTLDKLGIKDIKNNFKGNFEKEFKKIDKERKKEMERSPVYKSFRKRK